MTAILGGTNKIMDILLEKGADTSKGGCVKHGGGLLPIHIAVLMKDKDLVLKLFAHGASVTQSDPHGFTAIHIAAFLGDIKIISWLLDYAVASGHALENILNFQTGCRGATPIEVAINCPIKKTAVEMVKYLVAKGADLKLGSFGGGRTFHVAANMPRGIIFNTLLHLGAPVHTRNASMKTPLMVAAQWPWFSDTLTISDPNAKFITKEDLNLTDMSGRTLVMYAADFAEFDNCKAAFERGARLDIVGHNGETVIGAAMDRSFTTKDIPSIREFVKYAIEKGTNVTAIPHNRITVLHQAANLGDTELLKLIIDAIPPEISSMMVNLLPPGDFGYPLYNAVVYGDLEIARMLLEIGARVELIETIAILEDIVALGPGGDEMMRLLNEYRVTSGIDY